MPQIPQAGFNNTVNPNAPRTSYTSSDYSGNIAIGQALEKIGGQATKMAIDYDSMKAKAEADNYVTEASDSDKADTIRYTDEVWKNADANGKVQPTRTNPDGSSYQVKVGGNYVTEEIEAEKLIKDFQDKRRADRLQKAPNRYASEGYDNQMGSFFEHNHLESLSTQQKMFAQNSIKIEKDKSTSTIANSTIRAKENTDKPVSQEILISIVDRAKEINSKIGTNYDINSAEENIQYVTRESAAGYLNGTGFFLDNDTIKDEKKAARVQELKYMFNPKSNQFFQKYLTPDDYTAANKLIATYEKKYRSASLEKGINQLQNTLTESERTGKVDEAALTSALTNISEGGTPLQFLEAKATAQMTISSSKYLHDLGATKPSGRAQKLENILNTASVDDIDLKDLSPTDVQFLKSSGMLGKFKTRISDMATKLGMQLEKENLKDPFAYGVKYIPQVKSANQAYLDAKSSVEKGHALKRLMDVSKASQELVQEVPEANKRLLSESLVQDYRGRLQSAGESFSASRNIQDFNNVLEELGATGMSELYKLSVRDKTPINSGFQTASYMSLDENKSMVLNLTALSPETKKLWDAQKGSSAANLAEVKVAVSSELEDFYGAVPSNLEGMRDPEMLAAISNSGLEYSKARMTGTLKPPGKSAMATAAEAAKEWKEIISKEFTVINQQEVNGWHGGGLRGLSDPFIVPTKYAEAVQHFMDNHTNAAETIKVLLESNNIPIPPEYIGKTPEESENLKNTFYKLLENKSRFVHTGTGIKMEYRALNNPKYTSIVNKRGRPIEFSYTELINNKNGIQSNVNTYMEAVNKQQAKPLAPVQKPTKTTNSPIEKLEQESKETVETGIEKHVYVPKGIGYYQEMFKSVENVTEEEAASILDNSKLDLNDLIELKKMIPKAPKKSQEKLTKIVNSSIKNFTSNDLLGVTTKSDNLVTPTTLDVIKREMLANTANPKKGKVMPRDTRWEQ